ncbi:MAG TPA: M15 family metallopeptidase [Actinomycetes bacterium]|nr:M15 family metallopeptidase [Actinomycetes bacterium]
MKPTLPPLKRCLPPLLILACLAMAGCGTTNGGSGGAAPPGASDATAVKSGFTTRAEAAPGDQAAPEGQAAPGDQGPALVEAAPRFRGTIVTGRDAVRKRVRYSWRRGCPVGPVELRLLRADHWGFDKRVHQGELIVHRDHARRVLVVLGKLFKARYPIQRLQLVDAYQADDDRSMAANNTSGFNCRRVSGSSSWSEHAFGRAIDLNPLRNPYVTSGGRVSPPAGRPYANRARRAAGMIHANDLVVRAFAAAGWRWGGYWSGSRDYQHFSSTGR